MNWIVLGVLASLGYGFYNFFTKLAGEKLDSTLALLLFSGATFLFAIVLYFFSSTKISFAISKDWMRPILSGIVAGSAELFYLKMFAKGAPLAVANPMVVGGTVAIGVLLGVLLLRENITITKVIGVVVCITGIVLLAKS